MGSNLTDLTDKTYEYYKFTVSANSILKQTINADAEPTANQTVGQFILYDEEAGWDDDKDLFACVHYDEFVSEEFTKPGRIEQLGIHFDIEKRAL
jgi:hypothetical protein